MFDNPHVSFTPPGSNTALECTVDAPLNATASDISLKSLAWQQLSSMSDAELDNDWKLGEFFGTIAVINLPCDTGRLVMVEEELQSIGVQDFLVFPAIDGRKDIPKSIWRKFFYNRTEVDTTTAEGKLALERLHQGEAGCYMSHYLLIKTIRDAFVKAITVLQHAISENDSQAAAKAAEAVRKYSRVLILEDDNGFGYVNNEKTATTRNGAGRLLREALQELPDNWDMLYFMCAPHEKVRCHSPHLQKIGRSVFANAYAVNYSMYDPLIKHLKEIENPQILFIRPLDKQISTIHAYHRVFAINPSIAFQYNVKSSIDGIQYEQLTQTQPLYPPSNFKQLAP